MIFQSSNSLLLCDFFQFIPALYGQLFLFLVEATTISIYGMCMSFWGLGASFNTIFVSNHLFGVISPDNLSPYQGTLFLLSNFL